MTKTAYDITICAVCQEPVLVIEDVDITGATCGRLRCFLKMFPDEDFSSSHENVRRGVENFKRLDQKNIELKPVVQYGNEDINYLIGYLKEKLELPVLDLSAVMNRRFCYLTMKKFGGREKVEMLINATAEDNFWSTHITSFKQLYYKAVQIMSATRHNKFGVTRL